MRIPVGRYKVGHGKKAAAQQLQRDEHAPKEAQRKGGEVCHCVLHIDAFDKLAAKEANAQRNKKVDKGVQYQQQNHPYIRALQQLSLIHI